MINDGETKIIKLKAAGYLIPVTLKCIKDRIEVQFPYNKTLLAEIKGMEKAKWHGFEEKNPRKIWSIAYSFRNLFQLRYLSGEDVYGWYDRELLKITSNRSLFKHQDQLLANGATYKHVLWAAEMGTGKTLAFIELAEHSKIPSTEIWYIGPKSGVKAVNLELEKWETKLKPVMMTYDNLVKVTREWVPGKKAPRFVVFDESSRIKTPTAQRTIASLHLAEGMRRDWGIEKSYIILMTGTPAPKSPVDWWSQCEVSCPGFLKEGDIHKFKNRLCLTEQRESLAGGVYPHLITWLDDENKCKVCGQFDNHVNHMLSEKPKSTEEIIKQGFTFGTASGEVKPSDVKDKVTAEPHKFEKSKNEVAYLFERMKGLVTVLFKKDCLDLPEKRYVEVKIKPTPDMVRAANMLKSTARTVIKSMTLSRELSDGFQYEQVETGEVTCNLCHGIGELEIPEPVSEIDVVGPISEGSQFVLVKRPCDKCDGTGLMPQFTREPAFVGTPKDDQLILDLEAHEEVGRLIVWGGFQATIDRIVDIAKKQGWSILRVDGRGYMGQDAQGNTLDANELLKAMDASHKLAKDLKEKHDKVCFIGNARAGGMALTLTASPSEIFFSNGFDGEARFQAEDRFHRTGADKNRGCTIYDYICLASDKLALDNLKKKRKLQDMSLGEFTNLKD